MKVTKASRRRARRRGTDRQLRDAIYGAYFRAMLRTLDKLFQDAAQQRGKLWDAIFEGVEQSFREALSEAEAAQ